MVNLLQTTKTFGRLVLAKAGLEFTHRRSLAGALEHIKKLGFAPRTVIDVGAATGTFDLYHAFPTASFLLIEPLEEHRPALEKVVSRLKDARYLIAAAAARPGEITIHVHPDLLGSSLYLEDEESGVNGVPRTIPAITLDEACAEQGLRGPYLLKIDVQGAELDVLAGAAQVLRETEVVVLETSLFEVFQGGPQIADVIAWMRAGGFVVYDILETRYRLLDGAMVQADLAFVQEAGMFRREHAYATPAQRAAQDAAFAWVRRLKDLWRRQSV